MIHTEIRTKLTEALHANVDTFYEDTMKFVDEVYHNDFKYILYDFFFNYETKDYASVNEIADVLKKSYNDPLNFVFKNKLMEGITWSDNQFYYYQPVSSEEYYYGNYIGHNEYPYVYLKIYDENISLFFSSNTNMDKYNSVSQNYTLFLPHQYPIEEVGKSLPFYYNFDCKAWNDYIIELFGVFFPDYRYSKKHSDKMMRFLKPISSGWSLALEFDINRIKSAKINGYIEFQYYISLVLIHDDYDKKNKKHYGRYERTDCIGLGIVGHPIVDFFYTLNSFMPALRFEKEGNVTHIINKLEFKLERLNDTTINVIYDKQYEESAKRYVYYYMYGISYISKTYLKFLEKSIRDILNEKI